MNLKLNFHLGVDKMIERHYTPETPLHGASFLSRLILRLYRGLYFLYWHFFLKSIT
jgi:hypothetical protein